MRLWVRFTYWLGIYGDDPRYPNRGNDSEQEDFPRDLI